MNNQLLDEVTNEYLKERGAFKVGDGVNVHVRVREGEKERIQIFKGIVIKKGIWYPRNLASTHRIWSWSRKSFPVHSPLIDKVEADRER